jgi:large subunit ribosomal protein L10
MALTKQQKDDIVAEITSILEDSKMAVICEYQGISVAQAQELRRSALEAGSTVKVVKNRLLRHAASKIKGLESIDLSDFTGQLMYLFNSSDEVAPAKLAAEFAKKNPEFKLKGAFSAEGEVLDEAGVKALAALPSRTQMLAGLINTLQSPVNGVVSGLGGNLGGLIKALEAKAS